MPHEYYTCTPGIFAKGNSVPWNNPACQFVKWEHLMTKFQPVFRKDTAVAAGWKHGSGQNQAGEKMAPAAGQLFVKEGQTSSVKGRTLKLIKVIPNHPSHKLVLSNNKVYHGTLEMLTGREPPMVIKSTSHSMQDCQQHHHKSAVALSTQGWKPPGMQPGAPQAACPWAEPCASVGSRFLWWILHRRGNTAPSRSRSRGLKMKGPGSYP